MSMTPDRPGPTPPGANIPIDWRRLSGAFADDTAGVQWYLHKPTGDVVRTMGDDSSMSQSPETFIAIHRVRSKEQYRWMERYIAGLADRELATQLARAIAGKSAFQRFKAALAEHPGRSSEWQSFRIEQLWIQIRLWLDANGLRFTPPGDLRASWKDLISEPIPAPGPRRAQLEATLDDLEICDLEDLTAFAAFLRDGGNDSTREQLYPE